MPPSAPGPPPHPWLRSRLASFGYALAGLRILVATQPHARFHAAATLAVLAAGWFFDVSRLEWAVLGLAVGAVWSAEALNTALEWLVDLVHPTWAPTAGRIKDVAAAGVLVVAIASASVGVLVFWPYLARELGVG